MGRSYTSHKQNRSRVRPCLTYNLTAHESSSLRLPQKKRPRSARQNHLWSPSKIGYKDLAEVRQGKYFEITLNSGISKTDAEAEVEKIAREVLTNPVIEEFHFSLENKGV